MKIAIGSDHGGYELKQKILGFLKQKKYKVEDFGCYSKESCDYPLIGFKVAEAVSNGNADRAVLICRSGVGMSIVANKLQGIRAVACYNENIARSSREHNDCNVLVLAADYTPLKDAKKFITIFLTTNIEGERHQRRVRQIEEFESKLKGKKQ